MTVTCDVSPAESVPDPAWWSTFYDDVLLRMKAPRDARFIGFADDIAIAVMSNGVDFLDEIVSPALEAVDQWTDYKGGKPAPLKSECVILTK